MSPSVTSLLVLCAKVFLKYILPRILILLADSDDDDLRTAAASLKSGFKPPKV